MSLTTLQARLELRRVAGGQWETEDGSVQVVQSGCQSWAVVANGRVVPVLGVTEFSSLREAHGRLADMRDLIRERRAAA